ncbi:MAG: non-histone chromosomal MC1 family protein [Methanothrix sp.]|nr:non-histone chromosomal MC1 family protein [Methanothrix sp.]
MSEKRNFVLRDAEGNENGVFTGTAPRQAALKAATRGFTDIRLRERGTKKVHVFQGNRKQIKSPKRAPAWMPQKIWKPSVKKICVETLEKI